MTVERDWFWFWFWFYYALWLASVFTLVLVLRQSRENRSILMAKTAKFIVNANEQTKTVFFGARAILTRNDNGTIEETTGKIFIFP